MATESTDDVLISTEEKQDGSPLQSPSNPDIEPQQQSVDDESTDPSSQMSHSPLPEATDNEKNDTADNAIENGTIPNNSDLSDGALPNIDRHISHHRENDISTSKIEPIINEIATDNSDETPSNINENEQKQSSKHPAQTQTVLNIEYGHCSAQGIRPTMEDQVVVESSLTVNGSKCTSGNLCIYGVFDGHGGRQCAEYCASNLIPILRRYLLSEDSVQSAFTLCIEELDEKVIEEAQDASGSTCCIVLIDNESFDLFCCNVGDSRCILINHPTDGSSVYNKVRQLSIEHKPDYPLERQRIESANGWVSFGRVCGILAVSRSLGDKDFKYEIENLVISTPDVTHHKLNVKEDQFIIVACDGLFDVYSNQQCKNWMDKYLANTKQYEMQSLTEKLCHDAIHVKKSKDNVSILVLKIVSQVIEKTPDSVHETPDSQEQKYDAQHTNDVEETEEIKPSMSSNGSAASSSKDAMNDTNANGHADNMNLSGPKKHKFHVVMESDDNIQLNQEFDDVEVETK